MVPPLSGSKQLKMRYKPANDGPVGGRGEDPADPGKAIMVPSRHLWLGNITQKPTDEQVLELFASFGKVDSGGLRRWGVGILCCVGRWLKQPVPQLSTYSHPLSPQSPLPLTTSLPPRLPPSPPPCPPPSLPAVRVFPVKAYAFVNYADIGSAIKAMQAVDGLAVPQLTGAVRWLAGWLGGLVGWLVCSEIFPPPPCGPTPHCHPLTCR